VSAPEDTARDDADDGGTLAVDESETSAATTAGSGDPVAKPRLRGRIAAAVIAMALVASAALTGWLYVNWYQPAQETGAGVEAAVLSAAKDGTVALLSYSPDTLDQDFTAAKSRLTGDFLSYYTQFTTDVVTPAARDKSVKTTAQVMRAAVAEMQPNHAEVLVFIDQTTTSKENPDGAFAVSSVRVGLTKTGDAWLISSFDPV